MKKENNKIYKPLTLDKNMNPYIMLTRIATRWTTYLDAIPAGKKYDCSTWGYPAFDDARWEDSSVWLIPSMFYKIGTKNIHLLPACMVVRSESPSSVYSWYTPGCVAGAISNLLDYKWGDPLTFRSDMDSGHYVKFEDIAVTHHCFSSKHYKAPVQFYHNWKLLTALPYRYAIPIKGDSVDTELPIFDPNEYDAKQAFILGSLIFNLATLYNKKLIHSHV